jgi:hypothetical protein
MKYVRPPSVQHVSGNETDTSTTNIPSIVAIRDDSTNHGVPLQQQQQQQHSSTSSPPISINSIHTLGTMTTATDGSRNNNKTVDDQLPDFHLVESNLGMETSTMSFFSTMSNAMPSTSNNMNHNTNTGQQPTTTTTSAHHNNKSSANNNNGTMSSYDQQIYMLQKQQEQLFNVSSNFTTSNNINNNNNTSNNINRNNASRMNPPGAITIDTGYSKVVVETAKVVDKSSSGRWNNSTSHSNNNNNNNNNMYHNNNNNSDAMSIGSRMSMMSGLSRISDGNENDSIFSDLSKKIGNVSTRSMAMSEMSALEIQELNDEDDEAEDHQQQHRDEDHHHDIDAGSSATLTTMEDDLSK